MNLVKKYFLSTRPMFFPAVVLPILIGVGAAKKLTGLYDPWLFFLTILAGILYHAGMNVINDYFDHTLGSDGANKTPLSPFTGGSRMIQKGLISATATLRLSIVLLLTGSVIGVYLALESGPLLLLIGAFGLLSGVLYSAPPLRLNSRGVGEIVVGVNFGILTVLGSFYVQSSSIALEPFLLSLPVSLLISGLLFINEFPDFLGDKATGKNTLVVKLGLKRARFGLLIITLLTYLSIALPVALGILPLIAGAALGATTLALIASILLIKKYDQPLGLLPAVKCTVFAHFFTGVLLALSITL